VAPGSKTLRSLNQADHRQVKEDRQPLFAPPGTDVEPAQEAKMFWLRGKIMVTIFLPDFVDTIVAHFAFPIAGEYRHIGDIQLGGKCENDIVRHIRRIGQERSEKPNRTQL
jgi:hypothetical protein